MFSWIVEAIVFRAAIVTVPGLVGWLAEWTEAKVNQPNDETICKIWREATLLKDQMRQCICSGYRANWLHQYVYIWIIAVENQKPTLDFNVNTTFCPPPPISPPNWTIIRVMAGLWSRVKMTPIEISTIYSYSTAISCTHAPVTVVWKYKNAHELWD